MSKTLLIIAHTPSPNTAALAKAGLDACLGYGGYDQGAVKIRCVSPFDVTSPDLLAADAVIIGTTENIGYMAGATKDMFDRCYNDWLDYSDAKPVAIYIRAGFGRHRNQARTDKHLWRPEMATGGRAFDSAWRLE